MVLLHPASPRTRSKPLAACIAALCGLSVSTAIANGNVWNVTDCSDNGGPNTLRSIIGATTTTSGDTVNLSSAPCNTITLAAGNTAIPVQQANLRIQTTGNDHITIDGSALQSGPTSGLASRIFSHLVVGTLTLQGVTLTGGHVYPTAVGAYGGCIRSPGNVELINSTVTSCSAQSAAAATSKLKVYGGGIYASGNVTLTNSTVSDNSATSANYSVKGGGIFAGGTVQATHSVISGNYGNAGGSKSYGGGIHAKAGSITLSYSTVSGNTLKSTGYGVYGGGISTASGSLTATYSTISGNSVLSDASLAAGGAIYAHGSMTLLRTTISDNYSSAALGGIAALSPGASNTNTFSMIASTVSGNSTGGLVGGIGVNSATTKIYNSTIAFNTAAGATANDQVYGPGLALNATSSPMSVTLSSNLLSNNTYDTGIEADLTTANSSTHAITFNASPANNFIRTSYVPAAAASQLPDDTLSGSCPLLGPLRNNGGPTLTHALLSGSIAIDHGNNAKNLKEDQRGVLADAMPFKYPLPSGAVADIGAYEVTQADIVFNGGFDGCPDLP